MKLLNYQSNKKCLEYQLNTKTEYKQTITIKIVSQTLKKCKNTGQIQKKNPDFKIRQIQKKNEIITERFEYQLNRNIIRLSISSE